MPDIYVSGGSKARKEFALLAVEARQEDAQAFLTKMVFALEAGMDAGADRGFLSEVADRLHDACSDLLGGMQRDLDNEHLSIDLVQLDFSALDEVRKELGK